MNVGGEFPGSPITEQTNFQTKGAITIEGKNNKLSTHESATIKKSFVIQVISLRGRKNSGKGKVHESALIFPKK